MNLYYKSYNFFTTFSDGCLGSRNDEERSEMRYVMRIAELVNHQTLERILRFRVIPGSIPVWVSVLSTHSTSNGLWVFYWHTNVMPSPQVDLNYSCEFNVILYALYFLRVEKEPFGFASIAFKIIMLYDYHKNQVIYRNWESLLRRTSSISILLHIRPQIRKEYPLNLSI